MKKIFLFIFLANLLLFPQIVLAGEYDVGGVPVHYEGLVPCGKSAAGVDEDALVTMPCQFCHFFVMIEGIIDLILFRIVPVVAVLMLVIGGVMFVFGGTDPSLINRGKAVMTSVIKGLIIIFAAWIIINTLFNFIGLSDFGISLTGPENWAIIDCEIELPE